MIRIAKAIVSLLLALSADANAGKPSLRRASANDGEESGEKRLFDPERRTYILTFSQDDSDRVQKAQGLAKAHGGSVDRVYTTVLNGAAIKGLRPQAAAALARNPWVAAIEEVVDVEACDAPRSWGLDRIDQCEIPLDNKTFVEVDASGVRVYVLDTGIDYQHADFDGLIDPNSDCHRSEVWPNQVIKALDPNSSHGSHVASTICGHEYGVANCGELCSVQVLGTSGNGQSAWVLAGIDFATQNCIDSGLAENCVINMSLKGDFSEAENLAVDNALAQGVVVVVAAGNSEKDACNYSPASADGAITVGATDRNDALADFTNFGECVDIYAPGVDIVAADYETDDGGEEKSGTSMSSPHVAALAAAALHDGVDPAEVKERLMKDATYMDVDCAYPGTGIATTGPKPNCKMVTNPNCDVLGPQCAASGQYCRISNCDEHHFCNGLGTSHLDCCCCEGLVCKGNGKLKTCG